MKEDIKEIKEILKDIQSDIVDIKVLDARQNSSLEEHMRRTKAIEKIQSLWAKAVVALVVSGTAAFITKVLGVF